jgi:bifunctional non-homologous end joining protein LigD
MLLASGSLPAGPDWALELKWDGCRAQLRYDGHSLSLRSRIGRECSGDFPELATIADALDRRQVTLDGELVCLRDDGRPDFAWLRRRLAGSPRSGHPATLQVLDVLHLDGYSTCALPYRDRRALLQELDLHGSAYRTPAGICVDDRSEFVSRVGEMGLEGVVAKRLDSPYLPGRRSRAWIKHKLRRHERLLVTGIRRTSEGAAEAVFVARPRPDGTFIGAGSIELGLSRELLVELEHLLAQRPPRRRGSICWYPAEVSVIASVHGLPDGPVRDAILREIVAP